MEYIAAALNLWNTDGRKTSQSEKTSIKSLYCRVERKKHFSTNKTTASNWQTVIKGFDGIGITTKKNLNN